MKEFKINFFECTWMQLVFQTILKYQTDKKNYRQFNVSINRQDAITGWQRI